MKRAFTRRRPWMPVLALAAAVAFSPAVAAAQEKPDAAMKKLAAATGLFHRGLHKLAAQEYAEFLSAHGSHSEATTARYGLAICQYRLGQYPQAAALLGEVLKDGKFKQRDEALAVLGHCRLRAEAYAPALAAFDELLAKHPTSPHVELAALSRARALYRMGKKPDALTAFDAFIKKYPNSGRRPAAEYFLALSQEAVGKNAEAVAVLAALLKRHPNSPFALDAMLLSGQCLENLGKLDEAAAQYRRMIAAAPPARAADGHYSLGVVLYKAGKYVDSIKALSAALASPSPGQHAPAARFQLGLAQLAAGQAAEARKTLSAVVKADAARAPKAKYWLAQCDMAEGKHKSARAILDELARARPAPANADRIALDRAACALALGDHALAAGEFADFRQRWPKSAGFVDATYREAFCLHKLGKYAESHALCEQVAKAPAGAATAPAAELAAENLFLMGKYPQAAQAFSVLAKAAKDEAQQLRIAFRLGQCAHLSGDYTKAIELLAPLAANPKVAGDPALRKAIFVLGDAQLQAKRYKEAASTLARFVGIVKGPAPEARFKLGLAQLRSGNLAPAEKTLAAVMAGPASSPWAVRAAFEYGQLAYKQNQPAKAGPAMAKVVAANAPVELAAHAAYLLAWIDLDARKYPAAANRFAQMAQKHPKHPLSADAGFHMAVCLDRADRPAEALAACQAYVKAHAAGTYARQARHMAATCQARLGRHADAVKALSALAADKKTVTDAVLYELAWSQRHMKDSPSAARSYQRLLGEFPKSELATAARAELAELLYQQKKFAPAAALLEKVVADKGADPKTLSAAQYRLGWCHVRGNQLDKAAAVFAALAAGQPAGEFAPSALYQAGEAYARLAKFPEAQQHFSALLSKHPKHDLARVALLKLGEVLNAAGGYDKSAAAYDGFLKQYPKDNFVYLARFGMGWSLENRKQHAEARKWYAQVVAAHNGPTAARAQFQIGECFFAEGSYEQAVRELLKVDIVYAYPEWSARALYEAGRAFEQLKQLDQAKSQYALCVRKYKDSAPAALAAKRLQALGGTKP